MAGAEAFTIIQVIASIIAIVDKTKQVYDAASDQKGLPGAFREVAARLPIVRDILSSAEQYVNGHTYDASYGGAKDVLEECKSKIQTMEELFLKIMPAEGASRRERYLSAARSLGKESRVESLMKRILEDVQLLAVDYGMSSATEAQRKELAEAIKDVAALPRSLPERLIEESGFSARHSGSGAINQFHGDQYTNHGDGQFYHAQTMNIGSHGKS